MKQERNLFHTDSSCSRCWDSQFGAYLPGYNEAILLRSLPRGHDWNTMLNALGDDVFKTPHYNEEQVRIPQIIPWIIQHCPTLKSTLVSRCCVHHHRKE